MTILFVCSGNTCRSPLAVAAWQALENQTTLWGQPPEVVRGIVVESAGLAAAEGAPASPNTVRVAREWGVDLSSHRARCLSEPLVRTADLICTMTSSQAAAVGAYFTGVARNVRVLGEFSTYCEETMEHTKPENERLLSLLNGNTSGGHLSATAGEQDIIDPYGGSLEAYWSCANQIRRAVAGLATALRHGEVQLS